MDERIILQFILYGIFALSIVIYAMLDGFDLGIGSLYLFSKGDQERSQMIHAVAPVWIGNTLWIIIGSGVLFAAFPKAFLVLALNFSIPLVGIVFAFILRAVAIEVLERHHIKWRVFWDGSFFFANLLLAFLVGLVLGNWIQGLPIDDSGAIAGGITTLLTPYPLLVSLFGMIMFAMHGSIYLLIKTEGPFHNKVRSWAKKLIALFLAFWVFTSFATFITQPHMSEPFVQYPILRIFPFLNFICIVCISLAVKSNHNNFAFFFSCGSIFLFLFLFLIGTFPYIAYSTINPEKNSLTFMNSSVSEQPLIVIAVVSLFSQLFLYKGFKSKYASARILE